MVNEIDLMNIEENEESLYEIYWHKTKPKNEMHHDSQAEEIWFPR